MNNPLYEPLNQIEQDLFAQCLDTITKEIELVEASDHHPVEVFIPSGSAGDDLAREIARHKEAGQTPDPDKVTKAPSAIDVLAYMRERLGVR